MTVPVPDPAFLRAVLDGDYWRQPDGEWRHNTRPLTDGEAIELGLWADCRPGGTAHLCPEGWALLLADDVPTTAPPGTGEAP